jgi:transcriptional regulator with XRE-family HTH domain
MNGNAAFDPQSCKEEIVELGSTTPQVILHRLTAVRRAKGMPRRELAQRLGISVQELRAKEESADLSIGTLCQWASILDVPITELVVEPDECMAPTRLPPASATRLMKVAAKLRDRTRRRSIQRLAQTFVEQLAEFFPNLEQATQENHRPPQRPNRQPAAPRHTLPEHVLTQRPGPDDR